MTYNESKQRYQQAHERWFATEYPNAYRNGHYTAPKMPQVAKANGLTNFIESYLKWTGNHGERTGNMGVPVKKTFQKFNIFTNRLETFDNGIEWRKGNGLKGTSDIKGHIKSINHKHPIPVYIEIKIAKDRMSNDQKQYSEKINESGAFYSIVKTPEDFFIFYDYIVNIS